MNKKTLTSLEGSIEKWEAIVEGTGVDNGVNNCPLCQLFIGGRGAGVSIQGGCVKCPSNCGDNYTPYREWQTHLIYNHSRAIKKIHCPTCKELAQAELDHLKSLLPKE